MDDDKDGFGTEVTDGLVCALAADQADNPDDCDDRDNAVGEPQPFPADLDGDGFAGANSVLSCFDLELPGIDCDDTNGDLNPDTPWFQDLDGDGYGVPVGVEGGGGLDGELFTGCTDPGGAVAPRDGDCDDTEREIYPGRTLFVEDTSDPVEVYYDGLPPQPLQGPTAFGLQVCGVVDGPLAVHRGGIIGGDDVWGAVSEIAAPPGLPALDVQMDGDVYVFGLMLRGHEAGTGQMMPTTGGAVVVAGEANLVVVEITGGRATSEGASSSRAAAASRWAGPTSSPTRPESRAARWQRMAPCWPAAFATRETPPWAWWTRGTRSRMPGKTCGLVGRRPPPSLPTGGPPVGVAGFGGAHHDPRALLPKGSWDPLPASVDPHDEYDLPAGPTACDESGCDADPTAQALCDAFGLSASG